MSNRLAKNTCTLIGTIAIATCLHALPSYARKIVKPNPFPTSGKLIDLTNGDLMCYVDLIDTTGKKYTLGADFEICNRTRYLNQRVRLTYRKTKVSKCQGNDACGKSIVKNLIVKMELIRNR
jgi:hypothetical protein